MKPILSAALLLLSAIVPAARADQASAPLRQPNIVVIYIDDMGYADIGPFFGKGPDKGYATPNLDRMAAEGTKFTHFYSAQAVCSASRAALLTGCYPNRVGITGALMPHAKTGLSMDETTLAEICKSRGYATACFGKWHLGDAREFLPLQHGFDEYFGLPYSNDMTPVGAPHGVPGQRNHYPALPLISGNNVVNPSVDDVAQDRLTTWYTGHAVDFIHRHKDRPFFIYLPHTMVHVPLHVSEKFRGKTRRGPFGDAVEELDWSVGQILDALRKDGLDEKTLVVFSSDNGPWLCFGDHAGSAAPLREGKGTSWDGGVRVPTLMRWPGSIPAGRACDAPLMTIDLLPTVARLAGAKLPERKIDGLDITDVITGKTDASPHDALAFYYNRNDLHALRSGQWKLELPRTYNTLDGKPGGNGGKQTPCSKRQVTQPELYDLGADPGETRDVAAENPQVLARLMEHAERFRADLGDDATKRQGTGCRQPGRTSTDTLYPSSLQFGKAIDPAYAPLPDCVTLEGTAAQPNPLDKDGRITRFKAPVVRLMRTTADTPKGTALIFPSGGYRVLSVVNDGTTKAQFWNDLGYDAAILEYTISGDPGNPTQATRDQAFKDALASVRLVRGKAKELGLRGDGFVMMGGSAGGHLAARTVAELPERDRPNSLVLFYPAYLEEVPPGQKEAGMPVPADKLPRLFVTIATNDDPKWLAGARTYADAWNKAPGGAGKATFHLFDDGFHGFRKGTRAAAQWPELLKAFDSGK